MTLVFLNGDCDFSFETVIVPLVLNGDCDFRGCQQFATNSSLQHQHPAGCLLQRQRRVPGTADPGGAICAGCHCAAQSLDASARTGCGQSSLKKVCTCNLIPGQ